MMQSNGPLTQLRVVEFAGIGPAPFAGMLLADLGAEIIRIERHDASPPDPGHRVLGRGRKSIALNLKLPQSLDVARKLIARADILIEGFRPGVMERLGLGPEECLKGNPRLVYGRVTGWGQDGPLAQSAGHDVNYIALTGLLNAIGTKGGGPVPPLNLLGDFAGGASLLAFGILAATLEAKQSGRGQVVDAAMVDGASLLGSLIWGMRSGGWWGGERGSNLLDGGAYFYGTYECSDGNWISLAPIEPQFHALFVKALALDPAEFSSQMDPRRWPMLREKVAAAVRLKTQAEWCAVLEGTDVCFAPVLDFNTATRHPHNVARGNFIERDGMIFPAPAPRFSRTLAEAPPFSGLPGADTREVLEQVGFSSTQIDRMLADGVVVATP